MKQLLAIALIITTAVFFCPPARVYAAGTISVGTTPQVLVGCGAGTTCSATYSVSASAGSMEFFMAETGLAYGGTITAACNSGATAMTAMPGGGTTISASRKMWIFYSSSCPSGSQTFIATAGTSGAIGEVNVLGYTGVGSFDTSTTNTGSNTVTLSLTSNVADEWMIGNVNAGNTVSGGTGVTTYYSGGGGPGFGDSGDIATPQTYSMTFNAPGGATTGGFAWLIKPVATASAFNPYLFWDF